MPRSFSVSKETTALKEIMRQVAVSYALGNREGEITPENLILLRPILRKKQFTDFCGLIRSSPEGLRRCKNSDRILLEEVTRTGKACWHHCHAGIVDFAIPVKRNGKLIPVVGGQLFFTQPSRKTVRSVLDKTSELQLGSREIRKAVEKVPVIPLQTVKGLIALVNSVLTGLPEVETLVLLGEMAGKKSPRDRKLHQAVSFIRENCSRQCSTKDIAKASGITPDYLSHIFRQELGITVLQFRDRMRIDFAKKLLSETGMPVTQVAFSLGWNDSNYFSKVFKKETGLSPSTYQKIHGKDRKLQVFGQKS